ncbi:MAG TPA: hypothetical protein VFU63_08920, partial [Ktedonobacterales bacterium]|nr:hypothetical protein [Ktedonobacterales bacterium]
MMETQAQSPHQNRLPAPLARPWAIRLTATLGIVLMTVGLFVPAAGREAIVHSDPASRFSQMWTIGNSVGASLAFLRPEHTPRTSWLESDAVYSVVYSILTLGGLALIPLLWQPLSRRGNAAMRWVYAVWLALLTILAIAGMPAWWQFMSQPPSEQLPEPITLEASYILPGVIVFPLGVLVSAAA